MNETPNGRTAAAVYSGVFSLLGYAWTFLGVYSSRNGLFASTAREPRFIVGPIGYAIAFALAFISGFASVLVILLVAGYFAAIARDVWAHHRGRGTSD